MKAQSFHVVVFTLLFYFSLCSSDLIKAVRIATREYAGYRCGTTFFPRKYVLRAASHAAQAVQVDVSPEQKKINQYLQDQGFYWSAQGKPPNLYSWPIHNPTSSDPAVGSHPYPQTVNDILRLSAENHKTYFLVFGGELELVGVVYRPTIKEDVFKCEKEMEISNVPDNPDYSVFGFRCPTKSVSFQQVKDAGFNFQQVRLALSRESDRGRFDRVWQISEVKNLFYHNVKAPTTHRHDSTSQNVYQSTLKTFEPIYKWPIDSERLENHDYQEHARTYRGDNLLVWHWYMQNSDFTFVVLGKDYREVGVVQQVNIMNKATYVKCKLTASNRREPELIDSNLQKKPQKIDPQVEVDVFKCGIHYFKSVNALIFAAQASHEYKQRHNFNHVGRQFLSLYQEFYINGPGRIFLWEVFLDPTQVELYYPFSKIFKTQRIFIIINDFSDVLGVVQMGREKNRLGICEREVVPLEFYKNYVEQLKNSN
ncbi:hypothetical protein K3495_g11321 [Podosphaera aphanis]|nr:hypothetical protein K3495_g11321 [Podosphaera aphanis]